MSSPDTLILGAGPAGMAASFELARAGKRVAVVERASQVGGLAKTLRFERPEGTYLTDIGPHRFFSKNAYLYQLIGNILQEQWKSVPRHTRFFVGGKYYAYPIKLGNVLSQMPKTKILGMLWDYSFERVRSVIRPRPIRTFEDYALSCFGRTLAEFNILNYTEKIWGIPCNQINVDWASQRIAGLSPLATVAAIFFKKRSAKSLVDSFYYPAKGSGLIYETMRAHVEQRGGTVATDTHPVKYICEGNRVVSVDIEGPQGITTVSPSSVVSSVPLMESVRLFGNHAPAEVREAAKNLRFRAQVYLFLTVAREHMAPDNWIYFPNKDIPFGRISEMKNFSTSMCPPGKTSLFIEFFCFEGDEIWTATAERLLALAAEWLERLKLLKREEILSYHHLREPNAYPLYDLTYRQHTATILSWMDRLENFYTIGRPGRFRYTNQDHSLEMGILTARSIIEGKRHNVDTIGDSREYFERGFLPDEQMKTSSR
ncbi:MAG: FAD-dependent oxidoreductase [Candidatus Peribacteraceae bacterium]|nr:FAD-dependent oxidoreductase [Candidatus Peribacteraceae bacterium]MDD5074423.1 FAD-dependent oxidoreductase [Candidatus Peribacteraceae bacterium]